MEQTPEVVKLESSKCPNGCTKESVPILKARDRVSNLPGLFTIVRCLECDLERTDPRPTADTIIYYYPESYGPYKLGDCATVGSSKLKLFFQKFFSYSNRKMPVATPGRMLEIGCASGAYLKRAQDKGWVVEGIEFSPQAAHMAQKNGFRVHVGSVESAPQPEIPYDLVVGWMVLEHVHEPVKVLKRLKEWVSSSGYLILSVPDRENIARKVFKSECYDIQVPTHLYHFNVKSLKATLASSGWKVESIRWQRNCNTLLMSIEYWAEDTNRNLAASIIKVIRTEKMFAPFRFALSVLLGTLRQSGRMEVLARPSCSGVVDHL